MSPPSVAVLIPALDEEERLSRLLADLAARDDRPDEVIVSDGGSGDRTAAVTTEAGARLVCGPPGRGGQLNRAAAAATSDVLLFLHADTLLPPDAIAAVRRAVAGGAEGGGFRLAFDSERRLLRLGAALINLRTRLTRAPLGDQAQFVVRPTFEELGGFAEWPILEDLDFVRRLGRRCRPAILDGPVVTAARRFERGGVARTVAVNWLIWGLYLAGVSPHRLGRLYRKIR